MVEFLTLFLGLVSGPSEVAVAVGEDVAAVVLVLDGDSVARLSPPGWRARVDLGPDLVPHVLEAVAYDAAGAEVGRAMQRLNLPRPAVEASWVLQRGPVGSSAKLIWESALGETPTEIDAVLDGVPVTVDANGHVELPTSGPDRVHLLQAELRFPSGAAASAQLAFGGPLVEQARAELTAVPIRWPGRSRVTTDDVDRWLVRPGGARVVAVEQGGSVLLVVRGPGLAGPLAEIGSRFDRGPYDGTISSSIGEPGVGGLDSPSLNPAAQATSEQQRRLALPFGDRERVRLVLPYARSGRGREIALDLLAVSPELEGAGRGLLWLLGVDVTVEDLDPEVRLGDAIALSGLLAAQGNRRRAVLVALDGTAAGGEDTSRFDLGRARRYLEALGVPLEVWRLGGSSAGEGEAIDSYRKMAKAYQQLRRSLDQQWLVWIDGSVLPSDVGVRSGAPFEVLAHFAVGRG